MPGSPAVDVAVEDDVWKVGRGQPDGALSKKPANSNDFVLKSDLKATRIASGPDGMGFVQAGGQLYPEDKS